jgi:hypothetical protein
MARNELDVLLVGGSRQGWWRLAKHLEQLECHCWFAHTTEDVRELLIQHGFPLILSARPVTEGSNLMELLRATERTVFYSFPVENGCLWFRALPESISGKRAFTFRPNEFVSVLHEAVAGLRASSRQFPAYDAERRTVGTRAEHRWAASAHV